jgi:hypothetical protein
MADAADVDIAEVQCLRQEITTRITLEHALVALELAALGTGLTLGGTAVYVLAALAAISSFLWLLWMDQSLSTYKIAAYLAVEVAPRLTSQVGHPVLGWESFLRLIDASGPGSRKALYPRATGGRRYLVRSGLRADLYTPILFGGTPPVLLALYALARHAGPGGIWTGCAAGGLLWLYAISRFADFVHNAKVLDSAIAVSRSGAEHQSQAAAQLRQATAGPARRAVQHARTSSDPQVETAQGSGDP